LLKPHPYNHNPITSFSATLHPKAGIPFSSRIGTGFPIICSNSFNDLACSGSI